MAWRGEKPDGSLMSPSGPWLFRDGEEINDKVRREVSTNQALLYFGSSCDDPGTPFSRTTDCNSFFLNNRL